MEQPSKISGELLVEKGGSMYRGDRIDNGECVIGYYVYCRNHAYILPIYNEDESDPCFDERWVQEGADEDGWIEVVHDTVVQLVCYDKNRDKVFAGDKVRTAFRGTISLEPVMTVMFGGKPNMRLCFSSTIELIKEDT